MSVNIYVCVCVCVCVREREREIYRESMCVHACHYIHGLYLFLFIQVYRIFSHTYSRINNCVNN